ncbi:hypothetical protein SAMN05660380_01928 [Xylella fastidiosa]|jgi:hypothetical protein|nr:hypothetical protein XFEB_01309 [Xylella fastidiosa EB92.1]KAF0571250.1 hypothetical protein P305_05845 [Xylella fastidiosa subsp. fastidiosa Mus-1]SHH01146.1 hypothetical protein SAMN05660380_01928 [Xylella fastidiosa]
MTVLDGGKRIAACLLNIDPRLVNAAAQTHLDVDHLTGHLELLLMLVLGGVEQLAQDAVVQIDDFVSDSGHAPGLHSNAAARTSPDQQASSGNPRWQFSTTGSDGAAAQCQSAGRVSAMP